MRPYQLLTTIVELVFRSVIICLKDDALVYLRSDRI